MTEAYPRREMTTLPQPLVELVPVAPLEGASGLDFLPESCLDQLFIDVIHDGHWIPEDFLSDAEGAPITMAQIQGDYVRERDWGASIMASKLAAYLGLSSYARINVARVLMDFGRFPGSTPHHASHLDRFAINYPFSHLLAHRQKTHLLEAYYDEISRALENQLEGKLVKIAIHTYDQHNESGTERPAVSLMTRSIGYQTSSEMPSNLFDPLYPDILAEFTADRILRDRISLTLEKAQVPVAHNYPYCLPEGSLEVRYQVWTYFRALRQAFEAENPELADAPSFTMVWKLLMDTNLRSSTSEALRSYIHMYRRAPSGRAEEFQQAARAYEAVCRFSAARGDDVLEHYRFSPSRTSSIAIEVRKDLLSVLNEEGEPMAVRWDYADYIARAIAKAIAIYFREDRRTESTALPALERHTPWFVGKGLVE